MCFKLLYYQTTSCKFSLCLNWNTIAHQIDVWTFTSWHSILLFELTLYITVLADTSWLLQVIKNVVSALRQSDTERAVRMSTSLCFPRTHQSPEEFKTMRRACQCTTDDLALFQNCLTVLLVDRWITVSLTCYLTTNIRQKLFRSRIT